MIVESRKGLHYSLCWLKMFYNSSCTKLRTSAQCLRAKVPQHRILNSASAPCSRASHGQTKPPLDRMHDAFLLLCSSSCVRVAQPRAKRNHLVERAPFRRWMRYKGVCVRAVGGDIGAPGVRSSAGREDDFESVVDSAPNAEAQCHAVMTQDIAER
jgi:hypothetical protein